MYHTRAVFAALVIVTVLIVLFSVTITTSRDAGVYDGSALLSLQRDGSVRGKDGTVLTWANGQTVLLSLSPEHQRGRYMINTVLELPSLEGIQLFAQTLEGNELIEIHNLNERQVRVTSKRPLLAEGRPYLRMTAEEGYFELPLIRRVNAAARDLSAPAAIALSSVLLIIVIALLRLATRKPGSPSNEFRTNSAGLSSVQLAVLDHGSVTSVDFSAFLLELAQKGAFDVIDQDGYVVFLRRRLPVDLTPYERGMLQVLFPDEGVKIDLHSMIAELDEELFSAAVSNLYVEVYNSFNDRNFFQENPRFTHLRFKLLAILMQFCGLIIVCGEVLVGLGSLTPVVFGFGLALYISGIVLFWYSPQLIQLSAEGRIVFQGAQAFRNFLCGAGGRVQMATEHFFQYLPHAIVVGATDTWLARFRDRFIYLPDWYISADVTVASPERFIAAFQSISDQVATKMTRVKDPNAD
jgi:hypothetical protein